MEKPIRSESEILERFAEIVGDSLRIERSQVTAEAYLDDLGAESLDLIEITMESEAAFDIWISEKSILDTAIEVFGPGVLEQDGYLTPEGRLLMMRRLPEAEVSTMPERVAVQDLRRYFLKVSTWVRMISERAAHTPRVCAACGAGLAPTPGLRMKCTGCVQELALRSGEELNRAWVRDYHSKMVRPDVADAAGATGEAICLS